MDLQTVQLSIQAFSSTVVACGIVFAGLQFRHWRRVAHVSNFTKLVELQMHLREMRVEDPSLAEVYRHDTLGMRDSREVQEYFFNLMQLSVFEIVWFSRQEGLLPRDYFESWEKRMREIAAEESFRRMFTGPSMKIMHDDFQRYIATLVDSTPPRPAPATPPVTIHTPPAGA
ncbi:MAG: hypothetical protein HRU70_13175 [Phycisphaeraceae bacterium]|nr:MAG: hypothetical protein HRU70_13175 [Phycisphaeraceae bacterium]